MLEDSTIVVSNLTKKYCGVPALNDISFSIKKGMVVGLIGPNGAGKSSILKILAGLIPGTAGDVTINGVSIAEFPSHAKQHVSFMPENNPLPDHLRVGEYLRFRAELKGLRKIRMNAEKVMRHCDLYYDARYRMIKTLSKGYRQRVGIADAMLGDNNIVILDEPTIGLDPHQIIGVRKIIDSHRGNKTILISSHILSELETVCDNFIIINRGYIVAKGTLQELIQEEGAKDLFFARIGGPEEGIRDIFLSENAQIVSYEYSSRDGETIVKFSATPEGYRGILAALVDKKDIILREIGNVKLSLEEIFLYATRRSKDQDMAQEI